MVVRCGVAWRGGGMVWCGVVRRCAAALFEKVRLAARKGGPTLLGADARARPGPPGVPEGRPGAPRGTRGAPPALPKGPQKAP